jgi:hypothetical protein
MEQQNKERFMYVLAGAVVSCAAIITGATLLVKVPPENNTLVSMAIGQLLGMAVTVVGYFFGSSKSSADKNDIIAGKKEEGQ